MVSLYVTRADVWLANRRFASFVLGIIYILWMYIIQRFYIIEKNHVWKCTVYSRAHTKYNGVKLSLKVVKMNPFDSLVTEFLWFNCKTSGYPHTRTHMYMIITSDCPTFSWNTLPFFILNTGSCVWKEWLISGGNLT